MVLVHPQRPQHRATWPGSRSRTPPRPGAGQAASPPSPPRPLAACTSTDSPGRSPRQVHQPVIRGQEHHRHRRRLRERPPRRDLHQHPVIGHRDRPHRRRDSPSPGHPAPARSPPDRSPSPPRRPRSPIRRAQPGYMPSAISTSRKFSPAARTADPHLARPQRRQRLPLISQRQPLQRPLPRHHQPPRRDPAGGGSTPSPGATQPAGDQHLPAPDRHLRLARTRPLPAARPPVLATRRCR